MYSLIITLMAIALQALALFCLHTYAPPWTKTAPDHSRVLAAALSSFENAAFRYAAAHGGMLPEPAPSGDGALVQFQYPERFLAFMPKAPAGMMWRYGFAGTHYICLQVADGVRPVDPSVYYGAKRLKKLLPENQLVISSGAQSCGSTQDITGEKLELPATVSITFYLRYARGATPSTAAFPCHGSACLSDQPI